MKIAIFGSTGNTGLELVKQGLERGHEITAIVRNPEKLHSYKDNANLKIVTANILNYEELVPHLKDKDYVLSSLGVAGICWSRITFYSESIKSITTAMNQAEVKRLICMTSLYTRPNDGTYPFIYSILLRPMIGRQFDDMYEMEQYLQNESKDIDYTIVRPPRLTDQTLSTTEEVFQEDVYMITDKKIMNQTPRANVARFMLNTMEKGLFMKKGVAIDLPK